MTSGVVYPHTHIYIYIYILEINPMQPYKNLRDVDKYDSKNETLQLKPENFS